MRPYAAGSVSVVGVTVIIAVPHYEPWQVRGWGFRALAEATTRLLEEPEDIDVIFMGGVFQLLDLERLEHEQAVRVARALRSAADALRLANLDADEEMDRTFAHHLGELSLLLSDLAEPSDDTPG